MPDAASRPAGPVRAPRSAGLREWLARVKALAEVRSRQQWDLADALADGHQRWGERAITAVESATDLGWRECYRLLQTAAAYPSDTDRHPSLSWRHHVAAASVPEEDRHRLLSQATVEGWSYRRLEEAVRELRSRGKPAPAVREATLHRRLTGGRREAVRAVRGIRSLVLDVRRAGVERWPGRVRASTALELEREYDAIVLELTTLRPEVEALVSELRGEARGGADGAA